MGSAKALVGLLLAAAILGAVVLLLKPNYGRVYNLVSNRNFYSVLSRN